MKKNLWLLLSYGFGIVSATPLSPGELDLTTQAFASKELTYENFDILYFLPDNAHRAKKVICGLIDAERIFIRAALFRLTEPTITKALIDAHKRGVDVEVVIDPGALGTGYYSKVTQLLREGIKVYVYEATGLVSSLTKDEVKKEDMNDTKYQTIMHHKTLIFGCTINGKAMVTYGSLNLTHAGFSGNEEVVAIRNDRRTIAKFQDQFDKLKKRSYLLEYTAPGTRAEHAAEPKEKLSSVTSAARTYIRPTKKATSSAAHALHSMVRFVRRAVH